MPNILISIETVKYCKPNKPFTKIMEYLVLEISKLIASPILLSISK